ncbi:MAG: murein biosynthesis integral membrane protein MurJ [Chloroflexota bacterium]|nr:murein biosynthesis integral membrane protein MurJ [Chloroflexota bacterium]
MKHVARSSIIVGFFFGLEKVLGFVRYTIIARTFGLSGELDAFNAANNLPDLVFALISGGALAMALIPVLSEHLENDGRQAAWDIFSRIGNLLFIVTAGFSILIAIFANQIVRSKIGIAPGFDSDQQALVADLMRLNLIATLFFSMSGLIIAGLQANQHFWLPAIAPSMYDVGTLIGVLILVPGQGYTFGGVTLPAFGLGIHGLVYGTILGALLFLLVQIPGLIHFKFRWTARINLQHPGVQQVIRLMLPRIGTVFCIQLIFIAQDNFASRLAAGSVTALVYGWLFMQVPESLIGTAIGTALLPTISEQISRGNTDAFRRSLAHTVRAILALTLPSTVLLAVGIRPLVGILGFDSVGTELVVWTVRAYMLGLVGHSLLEVAARAFYAQQKALTPLAASGLTAVIFITLGLLLSPRLGAAGIGLANTIAFSVEAGLLFWLLERRVPQWLQIGKPLLRIGLASAGSGIVLYFSLRLLSLASLSTLMSTLAAIGVLVFCALLVLPFIWSEVKMMGTI